MFTQSNTQGYTDAELASLNAELEIILSEIDPEDLKARDQAQKAFADEVASR